MWKWGRHGAGNQDRVYVQEGGLHKHPALASKRADEVEATEPNQNSFWTPEGLWCPLFCVHHKNWAPQNSQWKPTFLNCMPPESFVDQAHSKCIHFIDAFSDGYGSHCPVLLLILPLFHSLPHTCEVKDFVVFLLFPLEFSLFTFVSAIGTKLQIAFMVELSSVDRASLKRLCVCVYTYIHTYMYI